MKTNRYLLGFALLVAGALPVFSQISNDNEDQVYKIQRPQAKDFVPGEVLFKLKDNQQTKVRRTAGQARTGIGSIDALLYEYGVKDMEQLLPQAKVEGTPRRAKSYSGEAVMERDLTQLYKVTLSEEKQFQTMQIVDQLNKLNEVEFAEPNYKIYLMDTNIAASYGSNPYVPSQWYLDDYGVKQLWNKPIINPIRPVIAILDTGVDMTHPDLKDNLWTNTAEAEGESNYDNDGNGFTGDVHGWDFINNTPNVKDFNMHGTHVAGIAAAANNDIGIIGANPMALIMPISVMQSDGSGDVATIIKGIDYAVANGATILNMSFGTYAYSHALRQALEKAYQKAVLVAAAGNDGYPINVRKMYPAAFSFVLGVQATKDTGDLASFSNRDTDGPNYSNLSALNDPDGFNYEMKAPGENILSTIPSGKYKNLNGTSMATPLVAGSISALKMVKEYDTQEILWGDLLHTDNIAQAYAVTNRPAELDLLKMIFRDRKELSEMTESDYSEDNRVDVGEIINIYPVIRTTFGSASNIKMHLEMGDEFEDPSTVEILTGCDNKVDFGMSLDSYGRGVSLNPLRVKIADNVADGRHIKMKIVLTCDESTITYEHQFVLVVDNIVKIGGLIEKDMTLIGNRTYRVIGSLGIPEGVTLTIEPGARLEFDKNEGLVCNGNLVANGVPDNPIVFTKHNDDIWKTFQAPNSVLTYCIIEYCEGYGSGFNLIDGILRYYEGYWYLGITGERINFIESGLGLGYNNLRLGSINGIRLSNFVNLCVSDDPGSSLADWPSINESNYFNVFSTFYENGKTYQLSCGTNDVKIVTSEHPSYLGTSREDIIRPFIYEIGNGPYYYGKVDLSNMLTEPVKEAHGIVWKVVVNGKDAQDEYEYLAPLGVGRHKFEVYFNRPMNKAVAPTICFGVRDPYTQNIVNEDGCWNEEGTIYTAYKTITGKTKSDGVNRIYVYGAEDNEYFECPYEKTRFNVNIQTAGSMATGFAAEAGMGRVNLTWDNTHNNFEDAMGFNIYRISFHEEERQARDENGELIWEWDDEKNNWRTEIVEVADTVRLNNDIVDIETTNYTDYDVVPGITYYYMYKVLSTDLQEYDISNVVAATPLTSTHGDANGSGDVDVADVITTVNYAAGMEPKPFIFEAADMNTDQQIDILDVIGIIQKILNPTAAPALASIESTAVYTIENGVLYVESPVELAGVQAQINLSEELRMKNEEFATASDLDGFEHTSAWLSDNDYLFLAYNMSGKTLSPGKHALLYIGNGDVTNLRLSNTQGRNVMVVAGEGTTAIDAMGSKVMLQGGVFNLKGQKVAGKTSDLQKLPKGVYIINGVKFVK